MSSSDPEFSADVVPNKPRARREEWDLPSDADMLRWVQKHNATVQPTTLGAPEDGWIVCMPLCQTGVRWVKMVVGRGLTPHAALEDAMKEVAK